MKFLRFAVMICVFVSSCGREATEVDKGPKLELPTEVDSSSFYKNEIETNSLVDSFDLLLEYPEDIVLFKSRKQGANNGGSRAPNFFFKPEAPGFYLEFMLFHPMSVQLRSESEWFDGLRVSVYRFGTKYGHYRDTSEVFISLKASVQEPELRSFNLVGKSLEQLKKLLGSNYQTKDKTIIYSSTNKVLIIYLENQKVRWFKYAILQENFEDFVEIPEELLDY